MNHRTRVIMFGVITVVTAVAVTFLPRTPQPLSYHDLHRLGTYCQYADRLALL
jgi:hypothetical protein